MRLVARCSDDRGVQDRGQHPAGTGPAALLGTGRVRQPGRRGLGSSASRLRASGRPRGTRQERRGHQPRTCAPRSPWAALRVPHITPRPARDTGDDRQLHPTVKGCLRSSHRHGRRSWKRMPVRPSTSHKAPGTQQPAGTGAPIAFPRGDRTDATRTDAPLPRELETSRRPRQPCPAVASSVRPGFHPEAPLTLPATWLLRPDGTICGSNRRGNALRRPCGSTRQRAPSRFPSCCWEGGAVVRPHQGSSSTLWARTAPVSDRRRAVASPPSPLPQV